MEMTFTPEHFQCAVGMPGASYFNTTPPKRRHRGKPLSSTAGVRALSWLWKEAVQELWTNAIEASDFQSDSQSSKRCNTSPTPSCECGEGQGGKQPKSPIHTGHEVQRKQMEPAAENGVFTLDASNIKGIACKFACFVQCGLAAAATQAKWKRPFSFPRTELIFVGSSCLLLMPLGCMYVPAGPVEALCSWDINS